MGLHLPGPDSARGGIARTLDEVAAELDAWIAEGDWILAEFQSPVVFAQPGIG
jgi:hypothetical protein